MYYLYSQVVNKITELPDGFKVKERKMNPFSSVHAFLWSMTKGHGKYNIYTLINREGQEVSFAESMTNCIFLRFLPKECIHIGPCYTLPQYRGKGYYPILIKSIASRFCGVECYMFVHDTNIASIKGIEKAGFKRIGTCKKFLNFYY